MVVDRPFLSSNRPALGITPVDFYLFAIGANPHPRVSVYIDILSSYGIVGKPADTGNSIGATVISDVVSYIGHVISALKKL